MTYRGQIKNGVVVFETPPPLKDGTPVWVEAVKLASVTRDVPPAGSREAVLNFHERWVGPAGELDRLAAEVQEMRDDADLTPGGDGA